MIKIVSHLQCVNINTTQIGSYTKLVIKFCAIFDYLQQILCISKANVYLEFSGEF